MKKHSKHAKLALRKSGQFAPNEISFLGVKCGVITKLVEDISVQLAEDYKIAYVDASHSSEITAPSFDTYTYHGSGNTQIATELHKNTFNDRIRFSIYDLVCVNGNHYPANKQIVFLDPGKETSIEKRIEEISAVQFFIKTSENVGVFKCMKEKFSNWSEIPVFEVGDIENIATQIRDLIADETPILNGLVLVGGKSTRMGVDKGLLEYHGLPQRIHAIQMLEAEGLKTYASTRSDQKIESTQIIEDKLIGLGPFGAICSAFMQNPNEAYLVLATDLPYVNKALIKKLMSKRNPKKIATAIKGKSAKFMEPLITIWEPKSYPILLSYLAQGYSCPRKILINSDVEIVEVEDELIQNINTPEEFKEAQQNFLK